jgi:hypothetical protein
MFDYLYERSDLQMGLDLTYQILKFAIENPAS